MLRTATLEIISVIDGERGVIIREVKVGKEPCDIVIDPKGEIIAISHEEDAARYGS